MRGVRDRVQRLARKAGGEGGGLHRGTGNRLNVKRHEKPAFAIGHQSGPKEKPNDDAVSLSARAANVSC